MATQLEKDVRFIKKKIETHIGDGGSGVHALANNKAPGFMGPKEFGNIQSIFNGRRPAFGQDINELAPGFYHGSNFKNAPSDVDANASCEVDVSMSFDGYKQITFRHNFENKMWTRTQHKGIWGLWSNCRQETLLWEGSVAEPNTPMRFAESYVDFDRLKFVVVGNSNTSKTYEVKIDGDNIAVPWTNMPDPVAGQTYIPQFQNGEIIVRLSADGIQFYIQWNTSISVFSGGISKLPDVGHIKQIWGVR
ncbi:hypothetical protein [Latilactobacillus phage TMW 1.46 P2]|uniref:hypothetical protein n=1 Tax=Latilactobacillus sakei TaxID=1599 RepID=UPI002072C59B|nr:hypothetical protein [Latilactobacillus sakei]USF96407.1 hypothetical protein A4W82_06100 [Latilactobacillus sakei]WAX23967.1 hypothetical protein [Latilactobacillus phage TMW 1.46 P2]